MTTAPFNLNLIHQDANPRKIKYIVLHCTAGPQNQTIEAIQRYWKNNLGWKSPGYHVIIKPDGTPVQLLTLDKISNGVANYNTPSIHISYIGGVDDKGNAVDNRTAAQKDTQLKLLAYLKQGYPNAVILGHRDFSRDLNGNKIVEKWEWIKSCPSFDVRDWLAGESLEESMKPTGIVYKLNFPLVRMEKVKEIQQALNRVGFNLKDDGYFGSNTANAVTVFQAKVGLKSNGQVDYATAAKLGITL